jgi:hypothetical protein
MKLGRIGIPGAPSPRCMPISCPCRPPSWCPPPECAPRTKPLKKMTATMNTEPAAIPTQAAT